MEAQLTSPFWEKHLPRALHTPLIFWRKKEWIVMALGILPLPERKKGMVMALDIFHLLEKKGRGGHGSRHLPLLEKRMGPPS